MAGVSRFDCYPSDFLNGIVGLSSDEIATYTVVMMLQYDRGVPVAYVGRERELSVRAGLAKGRLAKAIEALVMSGKLRLSDGALSNGRTSRELEKISERIQKNVENSQEGGNATKKKWENIRNENRGIEGRPASQMASRNKALLSPPSSLPPKEIEANASMVRPKKSKFEYPEDFQRFWSAYLTDANMSKSQAALEWAKLSPEDRELAISSCRPFRAYCSARSDYRPVHANRYLSERRFEGHAAVAVKSSETVFVRIGTPQWRAWETEYRRTRHQSPPVNKEGNGWHFPSEYPPGDNREHAA